MVFVETWLQNESWSIFASDFTNSVKNHWVMLGKGTLPKMTQLGKDNHFYADDTVLNIPKNLKLMQLLDAKPCRFLSLRLKREK